MARPRYIIQCCKRPSATSVWGHWVSRRICLLVKPTSFTVYVPVCVCVQGRVAPESNSRRISSARDEQTLWCFRRAALSPLTKRRLPSLFHTAITRAAHESAPLAIRYAISFTIARCIGGTAASWQSRRLRGDSVGNFFLCGAPVGVARSAVREPGRTEQFSRTVRPAAADALSTNRARFGAGHVAPLWFNAVTSTSRFIRRRIDDVRTIGVGLDASDRRRPAPPLTKTPAAAKYFNRCWCNINEARAKTV